MVDPEQPPVPHAAQPPDVLTVREAARLLRISEEHVRELAREGKIPAGKIGQAWRFSRRALLSLVDQNPDDI
ncbi:MAG: helix-turn-helix domain-containing protein [Solirubrobacteraceae bacterium]